MTQSRQEKADRVCSLQQEHSVLSSDKVLQCCSLPHCQLSDHLVILLLSKAAVRSLFYLQFSVSSVELFYSSSTINYLRIQQNNIIIFCNSISSSVNI